MLIHLDTDLGGDTDDACALAMLLGWPGVELAGVTTVAELVAADARYEAAMRRADEIEDLQAGRRIGGVRIENPFA
jgi:inosine-uridine nucleoside N-ribohydrolase